ncbi:splicing factor 3B subunit 4-like [Cyclospora cayetanensis]|uniref:Splicing factor 3B subunit 4-like n=1 Tax=Cyclospora cayetanensis TaxID=88456 RepID=A0A6P6S4M8_9EIME|nr:splicing factor 3B subunit 4-like [Cyclospora cayetanensis]
MPAAHSQTQAAPPPLLPRASGSSGDAARGSSSVSDISNEETPCRPPPSPDFPVSHRNYAGSSRPGGAPPSGWGGAAPHTSPHYVHSRASSRRYQEEGLPAHYGGEGGPPPRNVSFGLDACSPYAENRAPRPPLHATPEAPPPPLPRGEPQRHARGPRGQTGRWMF